MASLPEESADETPQEPPGQSPRPRRWRRVFHRAGGRTRRGRGSGVDFDPGHARGGGRRPRLTRQAYDEASRLWDEHGPANYQLDVEVTGNRPSKIHVEVVGGQAVAMLRDGVEPRQRRTWYYWTVPGMLDTIGQELDKVDDPARGFGAAGRLGGDSAGKVRRPAGISAQLLACRGGAEPGHGLGNHIIPVRGESRSGRRSERESRHDRQRD